MHQPPLAPARPAPQPRQPTQRIAVAWPRHGVCWCWLLWLALLVWPLTGGATPLVPERLPDGQATHAHLLRWHDATGHAGWEQMRLAETAQGFQPPNATVRAARSGAHWLKLTLRQPTPDGDWVLAMPTTSAREVEFWGPFDAHGQPLATPIRTGLNSPYASRPLGSERYVQHLRLPQPGDYTVYWRVASDISTAIEPTLWQTHDFLYWRGHKRLFDGLCYGILLALLIYNLALTAVFKDRAYGLYVLSCAFALLTLATFNGHTAHYLWPQAPWWIEHSYTLFPALWLSTNALFAREFLNTRTLTPRLDRLILGLLGLALVGLGFSVSGHATWAQRLNEVSSFGGVWLITGITAWVWHRGYRPAPWYLAGQLALFAAVVALVLANWGWLDAPWVPANALQTGVALELAGFAVALGVRIRLLQRQQAELSVQARDLAHRAATDPLTGVANRTGLVQAVAQIDAQPYALLLLDLDRFKSTNDTFGHDAGDLVLCTVAQRLGSVLRKSDTVARLGGDEFVVLLRQSATEAELRHTVQRLCERVNGPVNYGPYALDIQASIGVALSPQDGTELATLLKAADQAMYRAKQGDDGLAFYSAGRDTQGHGGHASQFGALG